MSERLGHATTAITNDTYSHVTPRMDAELAERQARRIFGDH
jgi:integrase